MKTEFSNVRPAIDSTASLLEDTALVVQDGWMYLRNRTMGIAQPIESRDFSCDALAFDHAMRRIPEANVTVTDKTVTVKGGGESSRLKQLGATTILPKPKCDMHDVPADLVEACAAVLPFAGVGDKGRAWTMGARIDKTTITATNAIVMAQSVLSEQSAFDGVTLPYSVLMHIVRRGDALTRWGCDKKLIVLEFEDGGWCAATRLNEDMPANIPGAMGAWTEPSFKIADDYRAKFLASVNHTEDELEIFKSYVYGAKCAADYKVIIETPLEVEPAAFDAKNLTLVMAQADAVGFDHYPGPTPFSFEGGRGLLAGRSKV